MACGPETLQAGRRVFRQSIQIARRAAGSEAGSLASMHACWQPSRNAGRIIPRLPGFEADVYWEMKQRITGI